MFYKPQDFTTPLHAFVQEYGEALQNAAYQLGGRPYFLQVGQLTADLQSDPILTPRMRANAVALHSLLNLDHVHDFDRPEAAYFTALDPATPIVEEICLLTDGYTHALRSSNILPDEQDWPLETDPEFNDFTDWACA